MRLALLVGGHDRAATAVGRGTTRKWRRNPLDSLEMDSVKASRASAVAPKQNRSSELPITLTAAASGSMIGEASTPTREEQP